MHSVQVCDIHSANNFKILQTHDVAWHLDWYLTSKGHSSNHFHYMECVQSNHSQTPWSKFSATCWIWTSWLTFRISVSLTTNAFRSNYWVSLYKLCNFGSWSESMGNPELKWRVICTHKPNSNFLPSCHAIPTSVIPRSDIKLYDILKDIRYCSITPHNIITCRNAKGIISPVWSQTFYQPIIWRLSACGRGPTGWVVINTWRQAKPEY